jgi:hypothetical protein
MTRAMDTAWRVHDLAADALVRVDAKAGFAAMVETAATAAVLTLAAAGATANAMTLVPLLAGGLLLAAGVVLAVLVVLPVLRSGRLPVGASGNFLFFGALAAMEPTGLTDVLVKALLSDRDLVEVVCEQAVTLSRLADRKHRLLRWSLLAAVAGGVLCAAGLALGFGGGWR